MLVHSVLMHSVLQITAWGLVGRRVSFCHVSESQQNSSETESWSVRHAFLNSRRASWICCTLYEISISCLWITAFHPIPNSKSDWIWNGRLARGWHRKVLTLKNSVMFPVSVSVVLVPLGGGLFHVVPERRIYLGANSEHSGSCLGLFMCLCLLFKRQVL